MKTITKKEALDLTLNWTDCEEYDYFVGQLELNDKNIIDLFESDSHSVVMVVHSKLPGNPFSCYYGFHTTKTGDTYMDTSDDVPEEFYGEA